MVVLVVQGACDGQHGDAVGEPQVMGFGGGGHSGGEFFADAGRPVSGGLQGGIELRSGELGRVGAGGQQGGGLVAGGLFDGLAGLVVVADGPPGESGSSPHAQQCGQGPVGLGLARGQQLRPRTAVGRTLVGFPGGFAEQPVAGESVGGEPADRSRWPDECTTAVERLVAGIHLEGPFLSVAQCGAHDPASLRAPDRGVLAWLLGAGRGQVRMVTVAPELPAAAVLITDLLDAGAIAAVGHTDASFDVTRAAYDQGPRSPRTCSTACAACITASPAQRWLRSATPRWS